MKQFSGDESTFMIIKHSENNYTVAGKSKVWTFWGLRSKTFHTFRKTKVTSYEEAYQIYLNNVSYIKP